MVVDGGGMGGAGQVPRWRETALWKALEEMRIEPTGAEMRFVDRLARENGWSGRSAAAVYQEYLRFLYLAGTSAVPLTPSDAVDQAWHLHLLYSRHYWEVLCGRILGRPFHHGPSAGGSAAAAAHGAAYRETLKRYRSVFGEEPPAEVWLAAERRFARRHVRVDRSDSLILPKARVRGTAALAGAAALTAACSAVVTPGYQEIVLVVVAIVTAVVVVWAIARRRSRNGKSDGGCGGGTGCGASGGRDAGDSDGGDGGGGGCGGD